MKATAKGSGRRGRRRATDADPASPLSPAPTARPVPLAGVYQIHVGAFAEGIQFPATVSFTEIGGD